MADIQVIDANTMFGIHPTHRLDMSVERLVSEMDRHHIAASLTLSTIGVFHDHVAGNGLTLEAAKANHRLIPIATVNPALHFGSSAYLQTLREQGFRILKLYPFDQGWTLDSAAFGDLLAQLVPVKMPILVNASRAGEPTAVGRMVSGYPAPVILCSVSLQTLRESIAVMAKLPNVMIETHGLHAPGALEMIAERIGADRVVFGSGAPRCAVAGSMAYVMGSDLSDEDKARVLGGNIKRILESV